MNLHCLNYEDMSSVPIIPNVLIMLVCKLVKCPCNPPKPTHTHTHTHHTHTHTHSLSLSLSLSSLSLSYLSHTRHTHTHTHRTLHTHTHTLTTVHSVSHTARFRRLEGNFTISQPTAEKHTPSSLYTQNTSHLPNSAFHNIESIGSVRASERVSRVNWFSSGLQSTFRESLVQFGASERVSRVICCVI